MNVSDLNGAELDAWVAKANGAEPGAAYSSDWAFGGRIIERERIMLSPYQEGIWRAVHVPSGDVGPPELGYSLNPVTGEIGAEPEMFPTPLAAEAESALVAAMRVYVASVFGEHRTATAAAH